MNIVLDVKLMKMQGTKMRKNFGKNICGKLVCILLSLFFPSCSTATPGEVALDNFSISFSKEIEKEYGLKLSGTGVSFPKKIKWIDFSFSSPSQMSIDEGRRLMVSIVRLFIQRMNEDQELLKYLANNPASLTNVELTLGFRDDVRSPLNSIMVIGSRNVVTYNKYNEQHTMLVDLHRETFEEAEQIVQRESKLN